MAPLTMTERGEAMLRDIPPIFHEDPDWRAVFHCYAQEADRMELTVEEVRDQFFPQRATLLLSAWEVSFGLTVDPVGLTEAERREQIILALLRMVTSVGGEDWEAFAARLVGAGFLYQEFDPRVPSNAVPPHTIRITLPLPSTSDTYKRVERALQGATPANTDVVIISGGGFNLDVDALDIEPLEGS